jgi:glutamyl-tRNA synthetase
VKAALDTCKGKVKLFSEIPPYAGFYFKPEVAFKDDISKVFTSEDKLRLKNIREAFAKLPAFNADAIGNALKAVAGELGVKAGILVHPTRMACTGSDVGPSLYHLLEVLGKESVLRRLDAVLEKI